MESLKRISFAVFLCSGICLRIAVARSAQQTPIDTCETAILPEPPCCGIGSIKHTTDERLARQNEFPWLVFIELKLKSKYDPADGEESVHCGGTLINTRWVLTAAHCFYYHTVEAVHLGETYCYKGECGPNDIRVKVDKTIEYKGFLFWDFEEDIALLHLQKSVQYSNSVRPICLLKHVIALHNINDKHGTVAGWGKTAKNIFSTNLQKAVVKIKDLEKCKYIFENLTLKRAYHMCASNEKNISPCDGDSGGPLMLQLSLEDKDSDNHVRAYYQLGIISFGVCGYKGGPIVYTNVTNYMQWIEETLRKK